MKKQLKKIFEKALRIVLRTITFISIVTLASSFILLAFCYAQGYATEIPYAVCLSCSVWLNLVGLFAFLEYKYGI